MDILKSFKHTTTNNIIIMSILLLIYIVVDFLLFGINFLSFLIILILQSSIILIAISPFGSWVLRTLYRCHKIGKTHKVNELFNEVYEDVKEQYPSVPKNIKLYYDRDMSINAYAIGSNSITITRGSVESLTNDQIKGILAHEFGHLVHKDTSIPLILLVGNFALLIVLGIITIGEKVSRFIDGIVSDDENSNISANARKGLINLLLFLLLFIPQAILLLNRRSNEYQADNFAYEVGYGEEILSALKLLDKLDMSGNRSILDRIKASHPYTSDRIDRLRQIIE